MDLPDNEEAGLRSITLPILASDIETGLPGLFRLWSDARLAPVAAARPPAQRLVVVVNRAGPGELARIAEIHAGFPRLAAMFTGLDVVNAGLTGDRDLYARDAGGETGAFGSKAGPNFLFEAAMKAARPYGGFTFQMELDCLPAGPDWLPALERVVRANARAWVIGAIFGGERGLDKIIQTHLNGNAVYKAGDPAFQRFLDEYWMPGILDRVRAGNPGIAYDFWWALECVDADPFAGNAAWARVRRYDGFFRNDPFLLNFIGGVEALAEVRLWQAEMTRLGRAPLFLHGPAMQKVAELMLRLPDLDMPAALEFLSVTPEPAAGAGAGGPQESGMAEGLLAMTGATCLVSAATRLLLDPRAMLVALEQDARLARHLEKALASPDLSDRIREHYMRACEQARIRAGMV